MARARSATINATVTIELAGGKVMVTADSRPDAPPQTFRAIGSVLQMLGDLLAEHAETLSVPAVVDDSGEQGAGDDA